MPFGAIAGAALKVGKAALGLGVFGNHQATTGASVASSLVQGAGDRFIFGITFGLYLSNATFRDWLNQGLSIVWGLIRGVF